MKTKKNYTKELQWRLSCQDVKFDQKNEGLRHLRINPLPFILQESSPFIASKTIRIHAPHTSLVSTSCTWPTCENAFSNL